MKHTALAVCASLVFLALAMSCAPTPLSAPPATAMPVTPATPTSITSPTVPLAPTLTFSPLSTNTPTATPTRIRTSTVTRVLTPTRLPANTAVPSASLDAVGVPANPRATGPRYSDNVNKANAHIYRYRAHQRDVEVYVEQEGVLTQAQERERADYCFEVWTRVWEIFGGYAFPIYECVVSDRLGDPGRGSSGITYWSRYGASFLTKPGWQDLMAHEIFHAWNYGHLPFEELWIVEGMAQYYNYLLVDPHRALQWVRDNAAISVPEWIKKGIDGPLVNIQRSSSNESLAYYKGALVWYMLDLEISERTAGTKSLNNVLRRLYLQYGTQGILPGPRPPAPSRQAIYDAFIAEAGSREFFTSFFKDYLEGARDLREWHNGLFANSRLVYLPPHPAIK